jgi:hypothetical protein
MDRPTPNPNGDDRCIDLRQGVTLAVFAPFGSDPELSTYPDGQSQDVAHHPLTRNLQKVAAAGVNVVALIDRYADDTWLVQIPAGQPSDITFLSQGKQDMLSPHTLANLAERAHRYAQKGSLILTIEGHGAGFLPDLDLTQLTLANVTDNGAVEWRLGNGMTRPFKAEGPESGQPLIEEGSPVLPVGNPTSPTNHQALSTWAYGDALRSAECAGVPRVSVLHFNNCFNMSTEVLYTVAPYADFATGYCNYNFFTAGQAYPAVFEHLATVGAASAGQVARWFAAANHAVLLAAGHEPTVAGTVELARMREIAERLDDLSDALLAALRTSGAERPQFIEKIKTAIERAQQYDSRPDYILEVPDELTDLDSLATELMLIDFTPYKVGPAAAALRQALCGIKQYGDVDSPWMDPAVVWNFSSKNLAMNIFLPDPMLNGLWDWRSQYYLDVNPDPGNPQVQPHIIDFVKVTDWVDFLIEYHRDTPFVGLLPALIPDMPLANAKYVPPPTDGGQGGDGGKPGGGGTVPR